MIRCLLLNKKQIKVIVLVGVITVSTIAAWERYAYQTQWSTITTLWIARGRHLRCWEDVQMKIANVGQFVFGNLECDLH